MSAKGAPHWGRTAGNNSTENSQTRDCLLRFLPHEGRGDKSSPEVERESQHIAKPSRSAWGRGWGRERVVFGTFRKFGWDRTRTYSRPKCIIQLQNFPFSDQKGNNLHPIWDQNNWDRTDLCGLHKGPRPRNSRAVALVVPLHLSFPLPSSLSNTWHKMPRMLLTYLQCSALESRKVDNFVYLLKLNWLIYSS